MISNDTPASPVTGAIPVDYFNAKSVSNTSPTIVVGAAPIYIDAFNLGDSDTVTVQVVGGTGSGSLFANYAPFGANITLTAIKPQVRLDWPGRYRLIFSGASVTAITVQGYPAQSSEPTIYVAGGGGGGGGGGFNLTPGDTTTIQMAFTGDSTGGTITGNAHTFALPTDVTTAWPGTLISANNLQRILWVTDDAPRQVNVGVDAGNQGNISGNQGEVCLGYHAGFGTTGISKIVIGNIAAVGITAFALDHAVIIGENALTGATPGGTIDGFVAIGHNVLLNTLFQDGVVIGRSAGGNTLGNDIVAIGDGAGSQITGDENVSVGNGANNTTAGGQNTAIGHFANANATTGARRVSIGYGAGRLANASNNDNAIFVGVNAGNNNTHLNPIVISSAATATNTTADNQIILGNSTHTELRTAGSIIAGGAISASDARLKDNVVTIGNAIEIIDQLRPVYFHWDQQALEAAKLPYRPQDCGKNISGFIAQELEKVIPELIENTQGGDGKVYNFVHYDRIIGLAFAGIKELITRNKALETRVADLELKGK